VEGTVLPASEGDHFLGDGNCANILPAMATLTEPKMESETFETVNGSCGWRDRNGSCTMTFALMYGLVVNWISMMCSVTQAYSQERPQPR